LGKLFQQLTGRQANENALALFLHWRLKISKSRLVRLSVLKMIISSTTGSKRQILKYDFKN